MTTQPLQFGRHSKSSHSHSHPLRSGSTYVNSRPKTTGNAQHDALVKQTQKWVSQTFYGELLKQMRNSPFKSKLMDGGEGGQAFVEMFDEKMAEKMATGTGRKLVDAIVNKIEAGKAYSKGSQIPDPSTSKANLISSSLLAKFGGAE